MLHTALGVDQEEAGSDGAFRLRFFGEEWLGLFDGPAEGIEASLLVTAVLVALRAKVDDPRIPGLGPLVGAPQPLPTTAPL